MVQLFVFTTREDPINRFTNPNPSPSHPRDIIIIIIIIIIAWSGRGMSYTWEKRNTYRDFVRNSKEKNHFGDLDVNGRIILNCIIKKYDIMYGLDLSHIEATGSYIYGYKSSGSINGLECIAQLRDYQLLSKQSGPRIHAHCVKKTKVKH
jgi:hypothetical protein